MDDVFDFPAAMGGGAMGGYDDEDEEAMKKLYADAAVGAAVAAEEEEDDAAGYEYAAAAMKAGEEKGIGKEGLRKKLLKEGEGAERPGAGDEVQGARSRRVFWALTFSDSR
jgi:hypothetical protein